MAVIAGVFAVALAVRGVWRIRGLYRIHRAGPRPLRAKHHRIWRDPGPAERRDLVYGPGGRRTVPVPPFVFLEEHLTGSQPCVSVRDVNGRRWRVKWGAEVFAESFAARFAHACGYFAEVTHFVRTGTIECKAALARAGDCITGDEGAFFDARFELDDPHVNMLFDEHSWAWNDNPFLGTAELSGLKIVVMLLSNWDAKDRRDVARGSNTAVFEYRVPRWEHRLPRWPRPKREARYLITDWGGAMGRWGSTIVTRGRWDPDGFEAQTPQFVTGVANGLVSFGYRGQHTADIAADIPVAHAQWFFAIASGLSERQLVEGLEVSGATDDEAARFARALLGRIRQLDV
jgi:hypothetical protein